MTLTALDTPYKLTPEQKESFERDGFLHLPDVLSADQVKSLQQWSKEVHDWPSRPGEHMPYDEVRADGTTGLCRTESESNPISPRLPPSMLTEDYANYHDGFNSLFRGERLVGLLSELMGERAILFQEKINYTEPGGSGGFDAHIDSTAYNHAGAVRHQTFLMAVDDMTPENGCLDVVPGSHKVQVPIAADKCIAKDWEAAQTWVPVPMKAGDLLVFGSYLAHRSGPNNSPRPRAAIYATYNGESEGDKHDSYYAHRRRVWPPTKERVPGVDYSEGAMTYAFGSPMAGGKEMIENTIRSQNQKTLKTREETADTVLGVIEA